MKAKSCHEVLLPQQDLNNYKTKENAALAAFQLQSVSCYLCSIMKADFTGSELAVNCQTCLDFVHILLQSSFKRFH